MTENFAAVTYARGQFEVSTDVARLDEAAIFDFLAHQSYWSPDLTMEKVRRYLCYSLCYGVYDGERQVGFGRVITDYASFGYIADIFIDPAYRGQGLGKWLVACIMQHPELQTLRKWTLNTRDAHTLYRPFGFQNDPKPENYMVFRPNDPEWTIIKD